MHEGSPPQDAIDPHDDEDAHSGKLARKSDPHTSKEAARAAFETRSATQREIVELLRSRGALTDEAIAAWARARHWYTSDSGLRTRRAELVEAGIVTDSGRRVKTSSGRRAILWEAT